MSAKLLVVGGGKMGEALVAGLLSAGWATPSEVAVVERLAERRSELSARLPGVVVVDAAVRADGVVLAVKPQDVAAACAELHEPARVLSIAAGVTLATLEDVLPPGTPVVRAMPNTPATVGAGAAAIAPGSSAGDSDLDWADAILSAVGITVRVPEAQLDAVTGLSGSGPAYVFLVAEAMLAAGAAVGLPEDVTSALVTQTILGAARLLDETDAGPEALRIAVTSPNGTTAAGLAVLDDAGVRQTFVDAVTAATERSKELGRG
jgi:pyrroline-5-carboxylate reductase